ncbi:MAG: response regulator [Bacteroidales bacterium]
MFGKLEETENQVLDLVNKIDTQSALELNSGTMRLEKTISKSEIAVCQWCGDMEQMRPNHQFLKNLLLPADASCEQIKLRIRETVFAEDLMRLKEEYIKLKERPDFYSLSSEFRQRLEGKTNWFRFELIVENHSEKPEFTFLCWNITPEKELCQSLTHRESILRAQIEKLSNLVLDLESRNKKEENIDSFYNYLSESDVYSWSWSLPEGFIEIDLPSLDKNHELEGGVYSFDKIIDKIFPDDVQKIQIDRNLKESDSFSLELRMDYDGTGYNWFEFRGSVVKADAQGNPVVIRGIFLDIQKRKNRELTLLHEIEKLREQEKNRSSLFANLTQEIRTPLHAIVGFADLLTGVKDDNERTKYLDIIKNNNETLLKLIEQVMEQTEADRPEEMLKKDSVCLWEYLVELHQIYSMKMNSDVKLMFSNSYDSRRVIIDKDKLGDIIGILISNAIQYTHSGYISYGFEYENDKLIFSVSDTGEGIDQESLKTLFLPYEKTDLIKPSKGISLSVCKSLVHRMDGNITVDSQPGVGTTFTIELPLQLETPQPFVPQEPQVKEQKIAQVVKNTKQLPVILVAEDTLYSFLMLKTLLEDRFNVIHAENGAHAIDLFREMNPVFVFMDIKMPVMDGIEATRRIREISQEVPIVVLTAYAVRSLRKDASEAGCTDMLTKPTSTKQINATIRKYLKKDN